MFNVLDNPDVHGDGNQDDQPGLQALIDNRVGALYFPPGRYLLESTLTLWAKTAYHLVGSGLPKPVRDGSNEQGAESVLVWGGSDGGTMVAYQGTGLVWSAVGLWGTNVPDLSSSSSSSSLGPRAAYGILIDKPSGGPVGTGKAWFDSLLIADCDAAIATDNSPNENCDTCGFGYLWIEQCDIGLHLRKSQAMQYTFQHLRTNDVGTIFKVDNGGRIFTQLVSVQKSGSKVLDVFASGSANCCFDIGGVVIRQGTQNVTLLTNDTSTLDAAPGQVFRFTNGHFDSGQDVSIYIKRTRPSGTPGNSVVELVGCRGVAALDENVTIEGGDATHKSGIVVADCEVGSVTQLINASSSNYWANGVSNWTFASGVVNDDSDSG
jgi:hypothetical protein